LASPRSEIYAPTRIRPCTGFSSANLTGNVTELNFVSEKSLHFKIKIRIQKTSRPTQNATKRIIFARYEALDAVPERTKAFPECLQGK
jgi:hypothetical protein